MQQSIIDLLIIILTGFGLVGFCFVVENAVRFGYEIYKGIKLNLEVRSDKKNIKAGKT